ncbi:hypothetical protein [Kitasatospora griseola]|uniref:hypothetical protein n=1 Tax=Kitasatospora griseola TaxID=2064 RepID=UPI0037FD7860
MSPTVVTAVTASISDVSTAVGGDVLVDELDRGGADVIGRESFRSSLPLVAVLRCDVLRGAQRDAAPPCFCQLGAPADGLETGQCGRHVVEVWVRHSLLSMRSALVLTLAVLAGIGAGVLSRLAGSPAALCVLYAVGAFGLAVPFFDGLVAASGDDDPGSPS